MSHGRGVGVHAGVCEEKHVPVGRRETVGAGAAGDVFRPIGQRADEMGMSLGVL